GELWSPRMRSQPRAHLVPYTTLFRSTLGTAHRVEGECVLHIPPTAVHTVRAHTRMVSVGGPCPPDADHAGVGADGVHGRGRDMQDRKSTRLNSSHVAISYAVFCLIKK